MGRKQNTLRKLEKMSLHENVDKFKNRHRFADSKYRRNIQFFYGLLKENATENLTKDVLLKAVLDDVRKMHDDIILFAGSQKLKKYNEQFLEVGEMGENIWKKEKNPVQWWMQMHEILETIMSGGKVSGCFLDIPVLSLRKGSKLKKKRTDSVL